LRVRVEGRKKLAGASCAEIEDGIMRIFNQRGDQRFDGQRKETNKRRFSGSNKRSNLPMGEKTLRGGGDLKKKKGKPT